MTCLKSDGPELTFATKADNVTDRQLVHKRAARAIVFIVSICCLLIGGGGMYSPLSQASGAGPAHQS